MQHTWGHRVKLPVKKEREWGPKVESLKVGPMVLHIHSSLVNVKHKSGN